MINNISGECDQTPHYDQFSAPLQNESWFKSEDTHARDTFLSGLDDLDFVGMGATPLNLFEKVSIPDFWEQMSIS